eukprot:4576780-Prymnesium_polylepis.1
MKVEKPFTLGHAIGLLQRFTARTGIQFFFQPEIRRDDARNFVQYRLIDIRSATVSVPQFASSVDRAVRQTCISSRLAA